MPPPIRVELVPYSAAWPKGAQREIEQLTHALGTVLSRVHHIGSTAIPGLAAKPIYDLMPVTADITFIDRVLPVFESLGYRSWGELGIAGRRYFTRDTETGTREAQLHCFQVDSPHVERHLVFRDYLRSHPAIRSAYHHEKMRCASLHSNDSHAYSDCKADWIIRVEAEALCWYRNSNAGISGGVIEHSTNTAEQIAPEQPLPAAQLRSFSVSDLNLMIDARPR